MELDENNEFMSAEQRLRELTKTYTGIHRPLKGVRPCESFRDLIQRLHEAFSSNYVNIEYVHHLMMSYKSNPAEWRKFAKFDRYRYTRNLVDAGNGKFNLMILCWGEQHSSAIHDHADSHCFMKMLRGQLTEVKYAWPQDRNAICNPDADIGQYENSEDEYDGDKLEELGRKTLDTNGVCYINDNLGLHRVENPSPTEPAVSLHLYCPPFQECSVFNKRTGKRTKCQVTFWSVNGSKKTKEAPTQVLEDK